MKNLKDVSKQMPDNAEFGRFVRKLVDDTNKPLVFIHGKYRHTNSKKPCRSQK